MGKAEREIRLQNDIRLAESWGHTVSAPWPLSTLAQFKEVAVVDGGRGKSERAWNLLTLQNIDFGPKKLLTAAGERWWRAGGPRGPAGWRMGGRPPSARSPAAAAGWVADPREDP